MLTYRHFISNHQYILKAFTGMITDSAGRKRYYVNGKPVKHDTYVGAGHKEHAHTHEQSIRTAVGALSGRASKGTSHADLTQLAEHLNNISGADLKKLRAKYGVSAEKNPNKEKLVAALLDHVRGGGPAVDVRKFKEQFGIAPPKEAMDSKAGRAKVNDLLARAKKGEDVIDEVKKLQDYDAGLDFGMDAMDEGKTGPTKRESDPETKQDKVTAEAEARNRWDKGQQIEDKAKGKDDPRSLASVGSLEQAKIEDQKKQEEMRKEPWQMTRDEAMKAGVSAGTWANEVMEAWKNERLPESSPSYKDAVRFMDPELRRNYERAQKYAGQKVSTKYGDVYSFDHLSDDGSHFVLKDKDGKEILQSPENIGPEDWPTRIAVNRAINDPHGLTFEAGARQIAQQVLSSNRTISDVMKELGVGIGTPGGKSLRKSVMDWVDRLKKDAPAASRPEPSSELQKARERFLEKNKDALAAGKPVPAEVLADYPDLANQQAAKTPEPNFTGRAANGVYYVNGVAQKKTDEATTGEQVIGSGNTGDVVRRDDKVYKRAKNDEGKIYSELKGVPGIAAGEQIGDEIVTPHYPNVVSRDTVKTGRATYGPVIAKSLPDIITGMSALSELGYDYNDPLQLGFDKSKKAHVMDFSNAQKSDEALSNNLGHLANYLKEFGLARHGDVIGKVSEMLSYISPDGTRALDTDSTQAKAGEHIWNQLGEKMPKYAYYSFNGRTIKGVAQTGNIDGVNLVFSNTPLSPEFVKQWEMHPAITPPAKGGDDINPTAVTQASPSKAAALQPPKPGFTGRASNGVYFINGVAQKQQDQPTAGMPRPSTESGLGSGSMQRLAAENKPAKEEEAAKQDAIGKYLSHIDPEQVKQLQTRHANVIDTLTSELKKAQAVEDDMLKQYTAADKSKKSSLGRKLNEAKEAANEALNKLADYKYETVDNRKAAIAIDPSQPDFVRLAAGMKPNDDEAANKVIELANQWIKEKGEDPRLGDLLASQVLERPLSAGEELGKLLQGEKNRLATMDARKDAAKYVAGLDLLPGQKAEAEREAAKLYNGEQDRFRQKWDAIQESSKADREKEKQAKAKRDKQQEEQAKTEAGIKSYLAAVDAGKPFGDASQDVLRGAAEHVLRSPEQWHSNYEMSKGMNAKQAVDSALKEDTTNAVGKTLLDAGWLTDRRYAVKATPAMKQHAEKSRSAIEAIGGKPLPITDILPKKAGDPAEVVAARNEPTNGLPQILLKSEFNKKDVAIDPKYYAAINAAYPDAKWSIIPQRRQAIATSNGEIVGLVMGMSDHDENGPASTSSIGKRRNFSDHFEPNPLGEGSIEESQRGLMIGHGTPNVAGVEIKKDGKRYIVRAPGIGKVVAPGLREAKAKAKEILLHAHGTDEQGNLILKPKA